MITTTITSLNSLWRPYTYQGTIFDADQPQRKPQRPLLSAEQMCGTTNGYRRHERRHEKACDPCREAQNAYRRDLARKAKAA